MPTTSSMTAQLMESRSPAPSAQVVFDNATLKRSRQGRISKRQHRFHSHLHAHVDNPFQAPAAVLQTVDPAIDHAGNSTISNFSLGSSQFPPHRASPPRTVDSSASTASSCTSSATTEVPCFQNNTKNLQPVKPTTKKPGTLQCNICYRYYSRRDNLRVHMRQHTGETPYKCTRCPASFKWYPTLRKHERRVHSSLPDPTSGYLNTHAVEQKPCATTLTLPRRENAEILSNKKVLEYFSGKSSDLLPIASSPKLLQTTCQQRSNVDGSLDVGTLITSNSGTRGHSIQPIFGDLQEVLLDRTVHTEAETEPLSSGQLSLLELLSTHNQTTPPAVEDIFPSEFQSLWPLSPACLVPDNSIY